LPERRRDAGRPAEPADLELDLEPEMKAGEREALLALALKLVERRPVPRAGWRSAVRSGLLHHGTPSSPAKIRALVFAYGSGGAVLLLVAAAGLAGIGPFAT